MCQCSTTWAATGRRQSLADRALSAVQVPAILDEMVRPFASPAHSTMRSASIAVLLAVSATALRTPSAQPRTVPAAATEHVASCGRRAALLAGAAAALGAQSPALAAEPSAGSCCRMQMQTQTQTQMQIERTQFGSTANHARAPEASDPTHALATRNAHRSPHGTQHTARSESDGALPPQARGRSTRAASTATSSATSRPARRASSTSSSRTARARGLSACRKSSSTVRLCPYST